MRFLIDENAPMALVDLLQSRGHDAVSMAKIAPSDSDEMVLQRARDESRIIVTLDLDFGALIYRDAFAVPPGVVQLRGRPSDTAAVVAQFMTMLDSGTVTPLRHFVVIEPDGRFRQLTLAYD